MRGWTKWTAMGIAVLAIVTGVLLTNGHNHHTSHSSSNAMSTAWVEHETQSVEHHKTRDSNSAASVAKTDHGLSTTQHDSVIQSTVTIDKQTGTANGESKSKAPTAVVSPNVKDSVTKPEAVIQTHHPTSTTANATTSSPKTEMAPVANSSVTSSTPAAGASAGTFTIIVSENHQVLVQKVLAIVPNDSLMTYMQQNFTIQTAYGGGFLLAINGIKSQWTDVPPAERKPVDWFLYVNGQQPPVGASSIYPRTGDVDIWDYHSWNPSTGQG